MLDAGVVEAHALQRLDRSRSSACRSGARSPAAAARLDERGDALLLQPVQLFVRLGDRFEDRQHAGLAAALPSPPARSSFPRLRLSSPSASASISASSASVSSRLVRAVRLAPSASAARRLELRRVGLLEHGAAVGRVEIDDVAQQHLAFDAARRASRSARGWSAGFRRCRRSSSRGRPRCAWRWRSRPRATAARPSPSRADTCAPDRRCGRYRRRRDCRAPRRRPPRPRRRRAPRFPRSR